MLTAILLSILAGLATGIGGLIVISMKGNYIDVLRLQKHL